MPVQKFSVSLPENLTSELAAREGERSTILARSLGRYFEILRRELRTLNLSRGEIGMILDVLNGTLFAEPFSIQLLDAEIEDALVDGYAEKWEIDGPALATKLRNASFAQKVAVVDAAERWWNRVGQGDQPDVAEALK